MPVQAGKDHPYSGPGSRLHSALSEGGPAQIRAELWMIQLDHLRGLRGKTRHESQMSLTMFSLLTSEGY